MTISQVIDKLNKEKQEGIPSRFPCRAIMVKNVQQYCELLSELQKIPDIVKVSPAELFSSADVMPQYNQLNSFPVCQSMGYFDWCERISSLVRQE